MNVQPEALRLFINIYFFALGAVIGSFLNVCIARLPEGKSLVRPASHCPSCGSSIRWFDNIPIVSFLLLQGKCRRCGLPISWQYPAVELLTAILFVLLLQRFDHAVALVVYLVFASALVVISFIDLKHYIIPNEISIPGIFIGLALSLLPARLTGGEFVLPSSFFFLSADPPHVVGSFLNSLIGCLVGGGLLYLTAIFSLLVFKKEGMGGGDIKLLAMVGAFLGWKLALMTIMLGSALGAIVGITLIILRLRKRTDYIPFGPYLALAALLSLLYGDQIMQVYLEFGEQINELVMKVIG
ncbi:MAG: prepilin peptidase [Candidatus Abyssobacteria bacterium SURF_5]|uniref:Prepilin peptidase n=1 Tax=Abyssobacteria bacterium (strain SURF_5) TaxID=2093360 RepID=A0A3A4NP89_ABYX5|nr:MAG: prepilin peptidase [Candidatus Abyssubacteria bacterium SURF_5]